MFGCLLWVLLCPLRGRVIPLWQVKVWGGLSYILLLMYTNRQLGISGVKGSFICIRTFFFYLVLLCKRGFSQNLTKTSKANPYPDCTYPKLDISHKSITQQRHYLIENKKDSFKYPSSILGSNESEKNHWSWSMRELIEEEKFSKYKWAPSKTVLNVSPLMCTVHKPFFMPLKTLDCFSLKVQVSRHAHA